MPLSKNNMILPYEHWKKLENTLKNVHLQICS